MSPALTRRRMQGVHQETWHVFYGDIQVGKIGERGTNINTTILTIHNR